jgi:alpha-galactosidase
MKLSHLRCLLPLACLLAFGFASAQQTTAQVSYDAQTHVFRLAGGNTEYAFGVNSKGMLQTIYWGGRLSPDDPLPTPKAMGRAFEMDDTPQEYAGWGGGIQAEPSLKITFPDGNRDLVLHYKSHTLRADGADIELRDIERNVVVTLHYTIDRQTGIIARSATIQNNTGKSFLIQQAAAAEWNLPRSSEYVLHYLAGRWGGEDQLETRPLVPGPTVLESRRGFTGHEFAPWFSIAENKQVTEREGEVWFGSLAWSGSWRITIEQDPLQQIRITGGFNPFDFGYPLQPGEHLETPMFYGGFANHGYTEMSHLESLFQRTHILPRGPNPRPRPVLYNSWEATEFRVSEAGQIALAEKAAEIGVERFVMDDGWFSTRKDDHSGLGDWWTDTEKFPHGLKPLIDKVHALGMDFGLWVEPEMVNERSELYRRHPDWIIHFDGRPETQARNQFVLNMAMPEVQQYVLGFLDKLVSDNDIAFLKWDANRNMSEPGWPQAPIGDQKKLYVQYVRGYYNVLRQLRLRHPKLEIESCSGGGGRVDLGVMGLTDEVSTSLTYRFLSAMQGSLGLGADLNKWSPEDVAMAQKLIAAYKTIRTTVQLGTLYRLISPRDGSEVSATESVSEDRKQAVAFAFLHSQQMAYPMPAVFPQGLSDDVVYTVAPLGDGFAAGTPNRASGAYWMNHGVDFALTGDFGAAAAVFTAVK